MTPIQILITAMQHNMIDTKVRSLIDCRNYMCNLCPISTDTICPLFPIIKWNGTIASLPEGFIEDLRSPLRMRNKYPEYFI